MNDARQVTGYGDDLNQPCKECGALLRDHCIGGPAPYHPMPVRPPVAADGEVEVWRCFHCDRVYTDQPSAEEHFGTRQYDAPLCSADQADLTFARKERDEYADMRAKLLGELHEARDALAAQLARAAPQAGEEWQTVPKEADQVMIDAGTNALTTNRDYLADEGLQEVWRAMLAAAPADTAQAGGATESGDEQGSPE